MEISKIKCSCVKNGEFYFSIQRFRLQSRNHIVRLAGQLRLYSYNEWQYSKTTMINETQHMAVDPTINIFAVYQ